MCCEVGGCGREVESGRGLVEFESMVWSELSKLECSCVDDYCQPVNGTYQQINTTIYVHNYACSVYYALLGIVWWHLKWC